MKPRISVSLALVSVALCACETPPAQDNAEPATASAKASATEHEVEEGCEDDHGKAAADDSVRKGKDPKNGAEMLMAGAPLSGAQAVTVKDLTENPDKYAGKVVHVEGQRQRHVPPPSRVVLRAG